VTGTETTRRPDRLRARWLVAAVALAAMIPTTAMAASLSVSSAKLTVVRTCVLTATSGSSLAAADSGVRQASPTSNFGTGTSADVRSQTTSNRRVYIRFDLTRCNPVIPSTATVNVATLRLYVTGIPTGTTCRTDDIFAVASSWSESAITWNNQPFGTALNNPASGQRTDELTIGPASAACDNTTSNRYVTGWSVTNDVGHFVAGTVTNNGWMIRDDAEGSATSRAATYSMSDAGVLAQSPQLVVTYTT
jgi:hypothetical protein